MISKKLGTKIEKGDKLLEALLSNYYFNSLPEENENNKYNEKPKINIETRLGNISRTNIFKPYLTKEEITKYFIESFNFVKNSDKREIKEKINPIIESYLEDNKIFINYFNSMKKVTKINEYKNLDMERNMYINFGAGVTHKKIAESQMNMLNNTINLYNKIAENVKYVKITLHNEEENLSDILIDEKNKLEKEKDEIYQIIAVAKMLDPELPPT